MKRISKDEKIRRVRVALGALLYELDIVKPVMSPEEFNLLVESILQTLKRIPPIIDLNKTYPDHDREGEGH